MRAAIIADDLTGASDSAASFASCGLRTIVAFSDFSSLPQGCDVAVADTESRDIGPERAAMAVRDAASALSSAGILFKKIDSTMRGSIGAELESALKASSRRFILIAPALPDSGRTTEGGCQLLNGMRLEETELARIPKSPVTTSVITDILARTSGLKAAVVGVDGLEDLEARIPSLLSSGVQAVICDGTENSHLALAAKAGIASGALLCGCAGLAREVSRIICKGAFEKAPENPDGAKSVLVLCGSVSKVTRAQARALSSAGAAVVRVDAALCVRDPKAAASKAVRELEERRSAMPQGVFAVSGAWSEDDVAASRKAALDCGISFEEAGERMARCMAFIASGEAPSFDAYAFTGGDTACHACLGIGASALEALGEIQPGVPVCRILAGPCRGRLVATKAGAFGDEQALCRAADFLMKQGNFHS
ncbi:MAG: four-carbon acid sugar kinase family protein [Succinivibrio sp.]